MAAALSPASAEEGRVNLKRVDAETGKVSPLTDGNFDLFSYDADAGSDRKSRC